MLSQSPVTTLVCLLNGLRRPEHISVQNRGIWRLSLVWYIKQKKRCLFYGIIIIWMYLDLIYVFTTSSTNSNPHPHLQCLPNLHTVNHCRFRWYLFICTCPFKYQDESNGVPHHVLYTIIIHNTLNVTFNFSWPWFHVWCTQWFFYESADNIPEAVEVPQLELCRK